MITTTDMDMVEDTAKNTVEDMDMGEDMDTEEDMVAMVEDTEEDMADMVEATEITVGL